MWTANRRFGLGGRRFDIPVPGIRAYKHHRPFTAWFQFEPFTHSLQPISEVPKVEYPPRE